MSRFWGWGSGVGWGCGREAPSVDGAKRRPLKRREAPSAERRASLQVNPEAATTRSHKTRGHKTFISRSNPL